MGKFKRALRSRRRLITVWAIPLILLCAFYGVDFCERHQAGYCEDLFWDFVIWSGLLGSCGLLWFWLRYKKEARSHSLFGFKNFPEQFDKEYLRLVGKVDRVLNNSLGGNLKRMATDAFRTMTQNYDRSGRFIHQRFLVTSPQLRKGQKMLILHNTKYGKISLRKGRWLEITGQYLHIPGVVRSPFGLRKHSFYGRIHHTHQPTGEIKVLKGKPIDLTHSKVILVKFEKDKKMVNASSNS